MYVCRRTLVALQIRIKCLDHPDNLVHEYSLEPEAVKAVDKGGIYELQCSRSKHHIQVKVQPALGLEELLPPYSDEVTPAQLSVLLDREMWPFLGIYYVLLAFVSDPSKQNVPVCNGYEDSPKHMEWLLEDTKMLDLLCIKCPVFTRSYGSSPTLGLLDHTKPKTRGLLLKGLLEVKMLIIRAVTQIRFHGETLLSDRQFKDFEALMMYVYEDCCAGGVEAQYMSQDESMESLRQLVCGGNTRSVAAKNEMAAESKDTCLSHNGHVKPTGILSTTASVKPATEQPTTAMSAEHSKLHKLQCKLGDALRHMALSGESLDEANLLNGNQLKAVRSCLAGLSGQVKKQLDEAEKRANELQNEKCRRIK